MNALLLRNIASVPRLVAFSEYREAEAHAKSSSVAANGALLEYETLELRVHPPNVEIDNETFADRTLITLDSANRPGTLVEVVQLLTELGLNVIKARISSDGGWFVDEFHVTDAGKKVVNERKLRAIRKVLSVDADPCDASPADSFLDDATTASTIFELAGTDRMGLLAEVINLLKTNGCEVRSAAVWTYHTRCAFVISVLEHGAAGSGTASGCVAPAPIRDGIKLARLRQLLLSMMDPNANSVVNVAPSQGLIHYERRLHRLLLREEEAAWLVSNLAEQYEAEMAEQQAQAERRWAGGAGVSSSGAAESESVAASAGAGAGTTVPASRAQSVSVQVPSTPSIHGRSGAVTPTRTASTPTGSVATATLDAAATAAAAAAMLAASAGSPLGGSPDSSTHSGSANAAQSTASPGCSTASGVRSGAGTAVGSAAVTPAGTSGCGSGSNTGASPGTGPGSAGGASDCGPPSSPSTLRPAASAPGQLPPVSPLPSTSGTSVCAPVSTPEVIVRHTRQHNYWTVSIRCRDRQKLLFDTVCTLADLNYDVYHGSVDCEMERGAAMALQTFYMRPRFGDCTWDARRAAKLRYMLECAIQRRHPTGTKVHIQALPGAAPNASAPNPGMSPAPGALGGEHLLQLSSVWRDFGFCITRAKVRGLAGSGPGGVGGEHTFYLVDRHGRPPADTVVATACGQIGGVRLARAADGPALAGGAGAAGGSAVSAVVGSAGAAAAAAATRAAAAGRGYRFGFTVYARAGWAGPGAEGESPPSSVAGSV